MENSSPGNPSRERKRALTPQEIAARMASVRPDARTPDRPALPLPEPETGKSEKPPVAAESASDRSRASRVLWRAALAIAAVFALSLFIPWLPGYPPGDLDGSWIMVLHWARRNRVDFGHDLIFTYGPLGFIWGGYDAATFAWQIALWCVMAIAFVAGLYTLARHFTRRWWIAAFWMIAVIAMANGNDVRLFALSWLLLLIHFETDDRPISGTKILLTVSLALATLVKFSVGLLGLATIAIVSVDHLRRRRIPWLGIIYVCCVLAAWLMVDQPLGGLPPWIYHSWLVAANFAAAQGLTQSSEVRDVSQFLSGTALLLALMAAAHWKQAQWRSMFSFKAALFALGLAAALLLIFKDGYVRHDAHEVTATTSLALLSLLVTAALWRRMGHIAVRWLAIVLLVYAFWLCAFSSTRWNDAGSPGNFVSAFAGFPSRAKNAFALASGHSHAYADNEARCKLIRDKTDAPSTDGSVDIFPWQQQTVLAGGLHYQPRPVFQSYTAYTPELERLNAEFLRGPHAPDVVLFEASSIDDRYPSMEDALCWPEILTRYDPADCSPSPMVLYRAASRREFSIEPVEQINAKLNEWIDCPDLEDPIWATIDLKSSWRGKLRNALYKPPEAFLEIIAATGASHRYRLIPNIAREGFLISPVVGDRMAFALLYSPQWKQEAANTRVRQFRVSVGQGGDENPSVESTYAITLSRLKYPHPDISGVRGIGSLVPMLAMARQMRIVYADTPPKILSTNVGKFVIYAPPKSQLLFPVPPGSTALSLGFGISKEAYIEGRATEGAQFRVYGTRETAANTFQGGEIWSRRLNPSSNPADGGFQTSGDILLPTPAPPFVLLEILPGPSRLPTPSFWADIQFK